MKLIDNFRNEHYNHSINTLKHELKLIQDTIIDLQKDIQTIKEFIVTYKASNNNQCNINENENSIGFLKKDQNTENTFSKLKFGAHDDDEKIKQIISAIQKLQKKTKNTNGQDGEEKKEEHADDDKLNVTAEAQLDMNDTKTDDNKMCMINVNMPVIHTAPVTEYAPQPSSQPSQNTLLQPQSHIQPQSQLFQNTQNPFVNQTANSSPVRKRRQQQTGNNRRILKVQQGDKKQNVQTNNDAVNQNHDQNGLFELNTNPVVNETQGQNVPFPFKMPIFNGQTNNIPFFKNSGDDIFPNHIELGHEQNNEQAHQFEPEQIPTNNSTPFTFSNQQ